MDEAIGWTRVTITSKGRMIADFKVKETFSISYVIATPTGTRSQVMVFQYREQATIVSGTKYSMLDFTPSKIGIERMGKTGVLELVRKAL